jgi:hypothetical protein
MAETTPRPGLKKPLTLPRSFSRVLGRLIALPADQSLPLARAAYDGADTPAKRLLAMRLRLRLLQEAAEAASRPAPAPAPPPAPAPLPEPDPEPAQEVLPPEVPEPAEPPKAAKAPKAAKLTTMDPGSDALSMMMSELGGSGDADDFFGDD